MRNQYMKTHKDQRDKPSCVPSWFRRALNRSLRTRVKQSMRECSDWDNVVLPVKTNNIWWFWW